MYAYKKNNSFIQYNTIFYNVWINYLRELISNPYNK